jgi:hypothetical protein
MRVGYVVIALWSIGCVVNGKAFGPSVATAGPNDAGSTGSSPPAPVSATDTHTRPAEPADPWAAVDGDQPVRWSKDAANQWKIDVTAATCTAQQDHCLVKDTWFIVRDADLERARRGFMRSFEAGPAVLGPSTPATPWNARAEVIHSERGWVAYRTVPATKRNVAPGASIVGLSADAGLPHSARDAYEASWQCGTVESVDFDHATYRIAGDARDRPLAGARIVVLSYRPGGTAEIVGGKRRDELAVTASEVFVPAR